MKQITIITENGLIVDIEKIPDDIEIKVRERDNLLNSTIWTQKRNIKIKGM